MRALAVAPALLALLSVASGGCDAPLPTTGPIAIQLGWRFADGRRCADTGAVQVNVTLDAAPDVPRVFACPAGERGALVTVDQLPSGAPLTVTALSPGGAVLYRGALTLPVPAAATSTVTLYFLGGP